MTVSRETPFRDRVSEVSNRSWLAFFGITLATLLFILSYVYEGSALFLTFSFFTCTLCVAFTLLHQPDQTLSPAKVFTLLYAGSFAYAPVWLLDKRIFKTTYFGNDITSIMDRTALIAFIGYCCYLLGYWFAFKRPKYTQTTQTINLADKTVALKLAWFMAFVGLSFYVFLVKQLGGLGWLFRYSGGRADILGDVYGGFFWGAHLIFVAYGFFSLAKMADSPRPCLFFAILVSALFVPFQGRDLVIAPIFCWLIAYHHLKKNISWKLVLISGSVIISLSGLVAAFRTGGNLLIMKDPVAFIAKFGESFTLYFSGVVAENIEQFDSAMIAVKFVENAHSTLGVFVLTSWLQPIDRAVLGGIIPNLYSGVILDLLVTPEHRGWRTALSPSIIGELWLSFGWSGLTIGMFMIGIFFARLSRWTSSWHSQQLLFAAYPFVLYIVTKLVVDGTAHLFRALLIFSAVWCLTRLVKSHSLATVETRRSLV